MTNNDIIDYIGKPWEANAKGPEAFDCWGLLVDVYKKQLNLDLPEYPKIDRDSLASLQGGIATILNSDWTAIARPVEYCAVCLSVNTKYAHHVGVFLEVDGGRVLHCTKQGGVLCEPLDSVKSRYNLVNFYAYNN
jgi:hypothetical protein